MKIEVVNWKISKVDSYGVMTIKFDQRMKD